MHALGEFDAGQALAGGVIEMHEHEELVHRDAVDGRKFACEAGAQIVGGLYEAQEVDGVDVGHGAAPLQ
jgi:hypothetical protein